MSDAAPDTTPPAVPEDDDAPDYVRLAILSSVLLVLIGVFVYTRFINPPKKKFYTDLPGVSLAGIPAGQLQEILKIANRMPCDCNYKNNAPCGYTVAECRHMDATCDVSLKHAAEIVRRVTGKPAVLTPSPAPAKAAPAP